MAERDRRANPPSANADSPEYASCGGSAPDGHGHDLGAVFTEVGFTLSRDPDTVRAPDLAFVAAGRIPASGYGTGYWEIAPDLAVEVVSPSSRASAIQEKVLHWLDAGAREVWIVDPGTRTVAIHRPGGRTTVLRGEDVVEGADLLPGFTLALDRLFAVAAGGAPR